MSFSDETCFPKYFVVLGSATNYIYPASTCSSRIVAFVTFKPLFLFNLFYVIASNFTFKGDYLSGNEGYN